MPSIHEFDLPITLDYDDHFPDFIKELININQDRDRNYFSDPPDKNIFL
jgi:hypothetical protein